MDTEIAFLVVSAFSFAVASEIFRIYAPDAAPNIVHVGRLQFCMMLARLCVVNALRESKLNE